MIKSKEMPFSEIDMLLTSNDENVRATAVEYQNLSEEQLVKAQNDGSFIVRDAVMRNRNVTQDNLSKALDDEAFIVRHSALKHPDISGGNLLKALDDAEERIKLQVLRHPRVNSEHIYRALNNDQPSNIREFILVNSNTKREHLEYSALNDNNTRNRNIAIRRLKKLMLETQNG
jgi:hypothetical protein